MSVESAPLIEGIEVEGPEAPTPDVIEDREVEAVEGFVVTDEVSGGDPGGPIRRIRVFDQGGDFIIDIPSDARMTFGYFNPGKAVGDNYGNRRGPEEKATCLRIYGDTTDKKQLAAFLGVKGFRDTTLTVQKLTERVTVETSYEDDGLGFEKAQATSRRALVVKNEDAFG